MATPTPVPFSPANYVSSANNEGYVLGAIYAYLGEEFRFLQNHTDGAITTGMTVVRINNGIPPFLPAGTGKWSVTYSNGAAAYNTGRPIVEGLFTGASVPVSNYFFALINGVFASCKCGATPLVGFTVVGSTLGAGNLGFCEKEVIVANGPSDSRLGVCLSLPAAGVCSVKVFVA